MEFQKFSKIPRLSRECIVSEKIDGTNGQINIIRYDYIDVADAQFITKYCLNLPEDFNEGIYNFPLDKLYLFTGSRNRWLDTSSDGDNYGFAKWVKDNSQELVEVLGEGRHYGEFYGQGINRGYGIDHKRFALFNVNRWHNHCDNPRLVSIDPKTKKEKYTKPAPNCCEVVPILYEGLFTTEAVENFGIQALRKNGSYTIKGYMNPEGVVIWHSASNQLFKKTLDNDEKPKTI